ncbi:MAG TPA: RNA polymerase factor sigma-54 [Hypericibacter adhaerens]|jgi:RNA polymerase sigma-54 factor|uniref:RNA polymerase sigma-54 factor n=1 Tax=Hypericibacter adhaerens TaxID=2602016 RepID=A0A5J6MSQ0_9PROT|nr:RNA polymerase factor sigma-54 [Hypericibacter adhaerens]QEX20301.1 RNA polymerase sigma-54 factor [Hypericibacter adhaerens]HWA41819.1 RNA polymerase factor sigma-54 [Hypericibacter adhaerens]
MAVTQRLDLRQSTSLVMTPQLQQAIKLLELSNLEVAAYVERELEQNPLLERDEDEPALAPPRGSALPAPDNGLNSALSRSRTGSGTGTRDGNDGPPIEETLANAIDLREHLTTQLTLDIQDPADRAIGLALIDTLDEAGYVSGELEPVAERLGCDTARVEAVLKRLQQFDPPGLFARNLKECLALQLLDRNRLDPAMQVLLDHLHLLAQGDRARLMRLCAVDAEDLAQMVAEIKALDPKPALAFDAAPVTPVTPDILMHRTPEGGWVVELNNQTLPRVLVNQSYYSRLIKGARGKEDRDYIVTQMTSANWLVKSLHQRAVTILKVATEIVRQQDGFFSHGVQHLKPLMRRDIAATIGMHESTVSRVAANKYIATPRGLYELRFFFSNAIADTAGGESHSAAAVRARIKSLIESESEVLSDDRLVQLLKAEGVDIARRTVAKYRESLRIPSSTERRRQRVLRVG